MREVLRLPLTCHECSHAFSATVAELDREAPFACPECDTVVALKSAQIVQRPKRSKSRGK